VTLTPERLDEPRPESSLLIPASASTARTPGGRLGEEFVALFCLFLTLCADLALVRFGLDAEDEGYFVEQATRVLNGQLPYRDFDSLYTPALLYLHAATLSLFSGSPIVDLRILKNRSVAAGTFVASKIDQVEMKERRESP